MDLLTALDDSIGLANLFLNRGASAWQESRIDDAIADFRTSADRYRRAGDVVGAALADNNVAEMLTFQGHLDEAQALLENAEPRAAGGELSARDRHDRQRSVTDRGLAGPERRGVAVAVRRARRVSPTRCRGSRPDSLVRLVEIHVLVAEEAAASTALDTAAEARRLLDAPR